MPIALHRACRLLPLVAALAIPPALADDGVTAFGEQRWVDAARLLEAEIAQRPDDALAELRLGVALTWLRRYAEARAHLDAAERKGVPKAILAYRRAGLLAQTGEHEQAYAQLDASLALGIGPPAQPESDPLLDPLRGEARFASFVERYQLANDPCNHDPRYRAFDFWVGAWDVRPYGSPPQGPASENIITLEYGRCIVQEHWHSTAGGTGSSFNLYDASRELWFQTWVDSTGGLHEYRGRPDGHGGMALEGETPGGPGQPKRVPTRLALIRLDADHVRQTSTSSIDGGTTWTTNYDLLYTRRADTDAASAR